MVEEGFEDCDWISLEEPAGTWPKLFQNRGKWPLEFHVPCREPLDHFLSMCNHRKRQFNCSAIDLGKEIENCALFLNRFSFALKALGELKCFAPFPMENYIDYSYSLLQPRRLPVQHVHRDTNTKRTKNNECLLKDENAEVAEKVVKLLHVKYQYYQFCDACMGSMDELFKAT
jgi:hypothetical protein